MRKRADIEEISYIIKKYILDLWMRFTQVNFFFPEISRQSNVTDLPTDEIFFLVAQLGNLYASEFSMDEERNEEIDQLLRSYYMKEYDIIDIMKYVRM